MRLFAFLLALAPLLAFMLAGCDDAAFDQELLEILRPPTAEEIARVPENYECVETTSGIACSPRVQP